MNKEVTFRDVFKLIEYKRLLEKYGYKDNYSWGQSFGFEDPKVYAAYLKVKQEPCVFCGEK